MSDEPPPRKKLQGKVVEPPYPTDDGFVVVHILAEDGIAVRGICDALSVGGDVGPEGGPEHIDLGMHIISELSRNQALMPLVHEAHRMRKAAGKPSPMYDLTKPGRIIEAPNERGLMKVEADGLVYDIQLYQDHPDAVYEYDEGSPITPEGIATVSAAGICWVLDHPEQAATLGVDVDLYRLYYE
ncbi:MAG: hypothetical protein KC492_09280 [Myxococcales bacterium]|nr:hypothetical protein [Myxococcales bacterium]